MVPAGDLRLKLRDRCDGPCSRAGSSVATIIGFPAGKLGDGDKLNGRRIEWLDLARGIGIVLVVAGHAERGLMAAHIARGAGWRLFDFGLYTFHMPLFMLLAGLNVPGSLRRGRGDFLRGKLWTIAWPYVLWSLVQGTMLVLLSGMTNGHGDWTALAKIAWQPISPFWFLYALMVYMFVVALVGVRARVLVPLALVGMLVSHGLDGDTIAHQICHQAVFFVAGVLAADRIRALPARPGLLPLMAVLWGGAALLVPTLGEAPYLKPAALPAAACGIVFVLMLARVLAGSVVQPLFVQLGRASMTIYVMHILGTAGARIALTRLHVPQQAMIYWIVCTAVGLGLPWLAHAILARCNALAPLGLAPRKRIAPRRPPAVIVMAPAGR
jgi:fucose 4-O-acetylase-like acetyltransferase